jgi:hypothetical protein
MDTIKKYGDSLDKDDEIYTFNAPCVGIKGIGGLVW